MAEAAETPQHRFFCYFCKRETTPILTNLVCPRCDSGFIEELTDDSSSLLDTSQSSEDLHTLYEFYQMSVADSLLSRPPASSELDSQGSRPCPVSAGAVESGEVLSSPEHKPSSQPEQRPAVEGMVQQFLADLFSNNGSPSSAPATLPNMLQYGDCVEPGKSGRRRRRATPVGEQRSSPCREGHDLAANECRLGCPVYCEDYSSGEFVRKLPCLHYFHSGCIVPWLELHDTCPVCRKSLNGVDNSLLPTSKLREVRSIRAEQQERQAI